MGAAKLQFNPKYTYSDYANWEGHWELIYGTAVAMSPLPPIKHQIVNSRIDKVLLDGLNDCRHCQALLPVDWRISDELVLQPDNLVVCEPLEEGNFIRQTPRLIFEIFSPATALKDRTIKHTVYEEQGVKYYVWVDPNKNKVEVYEWQAGIYERVWKHPWGIIPFTWMIANYLLTSAGYGIKIFGGPVNHC